MFQIPYTSLLLHAIILSTFLALYWKAGQIESPATNTLSLFWSALSLATFALLYYLGYGLIALILAQLALALLIALTRTALTLLPQKKS
jgi:hypothetical protein